MVKKKKITKKELPTEELKVVMFRWLSVCEPKEAIENNEQ